MKIGDLVRIRSKELVCEKIGIIIDEFEDQSGFFTFEVFYGDEPEWWEDINLEKIDE